MFLICSLYCKYLGDEQSQAIMSADAKDAIQKQKRQKDIQSPSCLWAE